MPSVPLPPWLTAGVLESAVSSRCRLEAAAAASAGAGEVTRPSADFPRPSCFGGRDRAAADEPARWRATFARSLASERSSPQSALRVRAQKRAPNSHAVGLERLDQRRGGGSSKSLSFRAVRD